mmetsp:Transcript_14265/g.54018  ORF Transcript_14265/g.54018 Transcript_14265/m.54018 type:complete len:243 (-) Transcript_14265:734-1462(-)
MPLGDVAVRPRGQRRPRVRQPRMCSRACRRAPCLDAGTRGKCGDVHPPGKCPSSAPRLAGRGESSAGALQKHLDESPSCWCRRSQPVPSSSAAGRALRATSVQPTGATATAGSLPKCAHAHSALCVSEPTSGHAAALRYACCPCCARGASALRAGHGVCPRVGRSDPAHVRRGLRKRPGLRGRAWPRPAVRVPCSCAFADGQGTLRVRKGGHRDGSRSPHRRHPRRLPALYHGHGRLYRQSV